MSKVVYTIVEKSGDKSVWLKIGTAKEKADGSIEVELDVLPLNGKLIIRNLTP